MFLLYDLIFTVFVLGYLPIFILGRKFHSGFAMRLGFLPRNIRQSLSGPRPIWLHAVSVGEALASKRLLEELHRAYPAKKIVISTVTSSGNKIARGLAGKNDIVIYLPLDFSFIVRKVIKMINPELFIIAETEIWPNLILYLRMREVTVVAVNARISDTSFSGYKAAKFLIKPILNKVSLFCVQEKKDSERLFSLGVRKEKIEVTGNMKFDNADYPDNQISGPAQEYRDILRLSSADKLLVAGSTHPPEEEFVLEAYKELIKEFPHLRLLIAPRHPDRARDIARLVLSARDNLRPFLISELRAPVSLGPQAVFILDIMGELKYFYKLADIVFVGGSLARKGGHNILEPVYFSKPIVFGPHMFNFRDMADLFISAGSVIQVKSQRELVDKMRLLLNNPPQAVSLGNKARELLLENKGATQRNMERIRELLT